MNEATAKVMFSSKSDSWLTPLELYNGLDNEFHFTTDPCADPSNHLGCKVFYTKEDDGLAKPWYGNVFCNPPYGRAIGKWVARCGEYAKSLAGIAVMLVPSRTDTRWFHDYIWETVADRPQAYTQVHFLDGRIKFLRPDGKKAGKPAFGSMIVVFFPPVEEEGQWRRVVEVL